MDPIDPVDPMDPLDPMNLIDPDPSMFYPNHHPNFFPHDGGNPVINYNFNEMAFINSMFEQLQIRGHNFPEAFRERVEVNLNLMKEKLEKEKAQEKEAKIQNIEPEEPVPQYLIPCMKEIFDLPHFWGEMEHSEIENILKDKPDGSFLFTKSTYEDHVVQVSYIGI